YRGRYFFADNANGRIWTLQPTPERDAIERGSRRDVGRADGFVVDLDVGPDTALYLAVMRIPPDESKILRIAPKAPRACDAAAAASSARGAASAVAPSPSSEVRGSSGDAFGDRPRKSRRKLTFAIIAAFALLVAAGLVLTGRRS